MDTKQVGIWIRVSTEDQAKGESPEHHEKRARMYAEAKGWHVVVVYHLEGFSGKSVMNHPESKKMLSDIQEGKITGIIFSKLARLARNTKELLEFAEIFRNLNADLISLQESIDTSTPSGRFFYTMIAAMAQWEREEIADRVAVSVPIRAKLGKALGGQASFGYHWKDVGEGKSKELVINEKEAPVRKLIYELFLQYKRKKTVANELNNRGYRTRKGENFSDTTVMRLLRDPMAKGMRRANYTKSTGDKKHWKLKPVEDWVLVPCPAIISEELWDECNRILDDQEKSRVKPGPRPVHLLAGYIYCSCGKKMYVFTKGNTYTCKPCKTRIPAADIDEIYHEQLKSFLFTDADVEAYLQQTREALNEKIRLLQVLLEQETTIKKKMNGLVELRLNGDMKKETFPLHYKPLEDQLEQILIQIPELQGEIDFLKIQQASSDTILTEAKDLYDKWPQMGYEEKRSIVETITESIIIDNDEISFNLSYLPSNPSFQNGQKSQHNFRDSC